jgi:predicted nucleic acid-binding Zn ribbon protein
MNDTTSSEGEIITKTHTGEPDVKETKAIRRCRVCLSTIPRPRFRYCSEHCADKGKVALQTWRRRHAREVANAAPIDPF